MGRRLPVVGFLLAVVGVLFGGWSQALATSLQVPGEQGPAVLQLAVGLISSVLLPVGGVVIAAAAVATVTGRSPMSGHPALLVWIGVGLVVASFVAEAGARWLVQGGEVSWVRWTPLEIAYMTRWVGCALVALWLIGLLTSTSTSPVGEQRPAADPGSDASTPR